MFLQSLLHLLYPPICFHCKSLLVENRYFCEECLQNFSLLLAEGHCLKCFAEISQRSGICTSCRKISSPFHRVAACFDSFGPGRTLLRQFFLNKSDTYVKDLASYFIIQIERMAFPSFDVIATIPEYFQNSLAKVAKEMARVLKITYIPILKRKLTTKVQFSLKRKCTIINKRVLLLHGEMQDRIEMRIAGKVIQEGLPEVLYAIAFCATL